MTTDLQEQALQIIYKASVITLVGLKNIIQSAIQNRNSIEHGQQSLKKLNMQGKKLESIEITGEDMKSFRRELNKYFVDFAIKKDAEAQNYIVFFKGQDIDRVYAGLQKCVVNFEKGQKKPMKEAMREAAQKAAEKNAARTQPEYEHSTDRGKDAR